MSNHARRRRSGFRLLAPLVFLGAALALGGCVVAPGGYYGAYGSPYGYGYGYPAAAAVSLGWGGGWYHGDHDWGDRDGGGGDWHGGGWGGHDGGWHH